MQERLRGKSVACGYDRSELCGAAMDESKNDLDVILEDLRLGQASLDQIISLSRDIGKQRLERGIPALLQLIDHDDEIVRYNAAMSLGFDLHYKPATSKLLAMLSADLDEDVRDVAAGALRCLWQNTKNPQILAALANASLNDPDEDVRKAAYLALLIVNGVSSEEHLRLLRAGRLPVDLKRVKSIVEQMPA
jgi:HEAT repeat protein